MNRLQALLKSLHQFVLNLLQKIEESSLFERWVVKWENLDPRHQKRIKAIANFGTYVGVFVLFVYPLLSVQLSKSRLSQFEKLQNDLKAVSQAPEVVRRPAPAPQGWASYSVATMDEFETNFESFLASIGISIDAGEFKKIGNNLAFVFEDVTLRQVMALVFQVDGWHPVLKFKRIEMENSLSNKVFLKVSGEIEYDPGAASLFQGRGSMVNSGPSRDGFGAGFNATGGPSFESKGSDPSVGASARNGFDEGSSMGDTPPSNMYEDDPSYGGPSGGELPPPPPLAPFEDD